MLTVLFIFQMLEKLSKILQTDSLTEIQKWFSKAGEKGDKHMHLHPFLKSMHSCTFAENPEILTDQN